MSKNSNKSMDFDTRHKQFLDAGKKLAKGDDVSKVTAAAIARACNVTAPLVFAHFKDRDVLRAAVRDYVKTGKVPTVKRHEPAPRKAKAKKPIKVAVKLPAKSKPKVAVKVVTPKAKETQRLAAAAAKKSPAKKVVTKKVTPAKPKATKSANKPKAKKPVAKKAAAPKITKAKFAVPAAPAVAVVVAE